MRQMTKGNTVLKVVQYIILANGWEYYITEKPDKDGIFFALVCGFETELGSVHIDEIKPYIMLRT